MKNSEHYLDHEGASKQDKVMNSQKTWEEPQLIILDSKKTLSGPNPAGPQEDTTYAS